MAHVFISYKREDGEFAEQLRDQFAAAGIDVWLDTDLRAGENWREAIDQAIREAFVCVVIMTPAANESEYVTYEWACAWGASIPVIPVILKPSHSLHPRLEAWQHLDFTGGNAELPNLLAQVRQLARQREELDLYGVQAPRGAPRAVVMAVDALDSTRPGDRKIAVDTLAHMNHPAAREALVRAARHPFYQDVRVNATAHAVRLAEDVDLRVVPGLVEVLADEDEGLRQTAAKALNILLRSENTATRAAALEQIRAIQGRDFVPRLITYALHDGTRHVLRVVANVLVELKDERVVPLLLAALRDKEYGIQRAAAEILVQLDVLAVPSLVEALETDRSDLHITLLSILSEIDSSKLLWALGHSQEALHKTAIDLLSKREADGVALARQGLDTHNETLCLSAIRCLGEIGGPLATEALIAFIDSNPPNITLLEEAVCVLQKLGDARAIPVFAALAERADPDLAESLAAALIATKDTQVVVPLIRLLDRGNTHVQRDIVRALGEYKSAEAVPALTRLVRDGESATKIAAMEALRQIGQPGAEDGLALCLTDSDLAVRREAAETLIATGSRMIPGLMAALRELDPSVRARIAQELGRFGSAGVRELLVAMHDPATSVQRVAVTALRAMGQDAIQALLSVGQSADVEVQAQVSKALVTLGASAVDPLLAELQGNADDVRQAQVIVLLGKLGDARAIPVLLHVLETSTSSDIQWVTADALGQLRAEDAVPALTRALEVPDKLVSLAAHKALSAIGTYQARAALAQHDANERIKLILQGKKSDPRHQDQ